MADEKNASDTITDVVELCALLECLGFSVKSLDASNTNLSQDEGVAAAAKTVVINCHFSGMHVVLESAAASCSCPVNEPQNSGFWQVSGVAGGKQLEQESGYTILRGLPKPHRERISKQLHDMIRCIRAINDLEDGLKAINKSNSMVELASKSASASLVDLGNKSASLAELSKEGHKSASILETGTPEKMHFQLKVQTPSRYRSLDTLTKDGRAQMITPIGDNPDLRKSIGRRQSTYTVCSTCSTPGSFRRRNKTSSPISSSTFLDHLLEAEKDALKLRDKLSGVIREYMEDGKEDSSISSMLDVSKISTSKGPEKSQFASSPNLSGISTIREEYHKSKMRRFESASTSNLAKPQGGFKSRLKRLSPNMFSGNKDAKGDAPTRSKLQNLFRPKIVIPVTPRTQRMNSEPSPKISSASKKKYSHIKSTIPRLTPVPAPKKE